MVLLVIIGFVAMACVIYLAISRKSDFKVRIAALGALALMILTVLVCLFLFFKTTSNIQPLILPDMDPSDIPSPPSRSNDIMTLVMFVIFLVALFVMIFLLAMREQRRADGKEQRPDKNNW